MSAKRCPSCEKPVPERAENPAYPFCSARCRAIDLGKWLGEEYRVADKHPELDEDGDQPPRAPSEREDLN